MKNEWKLKLSHENKRENLSLDFSFYSPLVLPSHLAFMHSNLVEVVQLHNLVKLTKTQLIFSLREELIIIIIIIKGLFVK